MKLNELKAWLSQLHPGLKSILNDDKYSWNWKDQGGGYGRENCAITINKFTENLWYSRVVIFYPKNYYNPNDGNALNLNILSKVIFIIIYDAINEEVYHIIMDNEINLRLFDYKTSGIKNISVKNIIYDAESDDLITLEIDKEI